MSSYVIFKTNTTLDIRAVTVLGLNAKPNSKSPIGFFGTGLKMAIATLVRNSIPVTIWIGTKCYQFSKRQGSFRDVEYQQIIMRRKNGIAAMWQHEDLAYTTQLAKNWELWMAFRELEANTRDENGETYTLTNEPTTYHVGKEGETSIIVGPSEEFAKQFMNSGTIFLPDGLTTQGENPNIQIFKKESNYLYYRSMRVMELKKPSIFTYNILSTQPLTEDRTLKDQWWVPYQIAQFLAASTDRPLINQLLNASDKHYEHDLPIDTVESPSTEFVDVVKTRRRTSAQGGGGRYSYIPLSHSPRMSTFIGKHTAPRKESLYRRFKDWRSDNPNQLEADNELFDEVESALRSQEIGDF
jgi:hypothetical protein